MFIIFFSIISTKFRVIMEWAAEGYERRTGGAGGG
jgi:hypothetical protein